MTPVIPEDDLPVDENTVIKEIEEIIGIEAEDAPRVSAKSGIGIDELLEAAIKYKWDDNYLVDKRTFGNCPKNRDFS